MFNFLKNNNVTKPVVTINEFKGVQITQTNAVELFDPLMFDLLRKATPYKSESSMVTIIRRFLHPHGHNGSTDKMGNLSIKVGKETKTVFSCHLDTVHHVVADVDIFLSNGPTNKMEGFVYGKQSGARSVLGADDKVGAWIMCQLIVAKVPGLYLFHVGEEAGCIGSGYIADTTPEVIKGYDRCIAFDRMNYTDVINIQRGGTCCSIEFADGLSKQMNLALDTRIPKRSKTFQFGPARGIYTDSAEYTKIIPECTNLSVGYWNQHGPREHFDWSWVKNILMPSLLTVQWEELPVKRDPKKVIPTYVAWNKNTGGASSTTGLVNGNSKYKNLPPGLTHTAFWLPEHGLDATLTIFSQRQQIEKWQHMKTHAFITSMVEHLKAQSKQENLISEGYVLVEATCEILEQMKEGKTKINDDDLDNAIDALQEHIANVWVSAPMLILDDTDDDDDDIESPGVCPNPPTNIVFDSVVGTLVQRTKGWDVDKKGKKVWIKYQQYTDVTVGIVDVNASPITFNDLQYSKNGRQLYYRISNFRLPTLFHTIKGTEKFLKPDVLRK